MGIPYRNQEDGVVKNPKENSIKEPDGQNGNRAGVVLPSGMNRREFIKTSALGVLGAHLLLTGCDTPEEKSTAALEKIQIGGMHYRRLGRTGLMISEISLGGSPVPTESVFRKAVEMGVNYVDTSSFYSFGNSERSIAKIIKGRRDTFYVGTKFHPGRNVTSFFRRKTKEALIEEAEGSLKRLQTDYVDILLVHGAADPAVLASSEVLGAFDQLKRDGKIRFTGVSCHKDPVRVLTPAINSGSYDMITVGYNAYSGTGFEKGKVYDDYLAGSGIAQVISLAREKDVGVVAMKSMAGGDRQNLAGLKTEGVSLPQAKLKWVLRNDAVSTVISEMTTFEILEENLSVTGKDLAAAEEQGLARYVRATGGDYCRMCGTCLRICPKGIAVPDIMRYVMYYERYGKTRYAVNSYHDLPPAATFLGCTRCGECETSCPYGLTIVLKLRRAHRMLA
ncbi:MAG: aldo/keto reductase [Thermodesulfobacteriota bacterium]